jgi:hypothetical protein
MNLEPEIKQDIITFEEIIKNIQDEQYTVYERSHMIEFLAVFERNELISQLLLKLLNESVNDIFIESAAIACLNHYNDEICDKLKEITLSNAYNVSTKNTCEIILNNIDLLRNEIEHD